nr:hypothetical protein [Paenibacillus terrigena]
MALGSQPLRGQGGPARDQLPTTHRAPYRSTRNFAKAAKSREQCRRPADIGGRKATRAPRSIRTVTAEPRRNPS